MLRLVAICLCVAHTVIGVPLRDFYMVGSRTTTKTLGQSVQADCTTFVPGGFMMYGEIYDIVCVSKATPNETVVSRPDFFKIWCGREAYHHLANSHY